MKDLDYGLMLDLEVKMDDEPNTTIRCYLQRLLSMVLEYGECFDGKRPFGNSD